MPLLARHRRYLGILVVGLFGLLLVSNVIPDPMGRMTWREKVAPELPLDRKIGLWFRNLGTFLGDNFGFRASLPVLRREMREVLDSPDSRPFYVGRDGQLFWGHEQTPAQSAGALLRRANIARFVDMIGEMQQILEPLGTRMVVAMPPNTQSVELEALPEWNDGLNYRVTEYELVMSGLAARGVTTVDLRKVLREAPRPRYLLTDTHWNRRSSLLAFNAVMVGAGHPDWQVDPEKVLGPLEPASRGDLLRTMRMPPEVKEENFRLTLPTPEPPMRTDPALGTTNPVGNFASVVYDYAPKGMRVLIMGDSFTVGMWPKLFSNAPVKEVGWMHASARPTGNCDFDFDTVKRFAPDLLIYVRSERFVPCFGADWPTGLPRLWLNAVPRHAAP